ncbi:MAG: hypothetical protein R3240_00055 [Gammaproteobacteria bacterium]|nr:hypothetical protein [Gammaproteobacteria bacterium]
MELVVEIDETSGSINAKNEFGGIWCLGVVYDPKTIPNDFKTYGKDAGLALTELSEIRRQLDVKTEQYETSKDHAEELSKQLDLVHAKLHATEKELEAVQSQVNEREPRDVLELTKLLQEGVTPKELVELADAGLL